MIRERLGTLVKDILFDRGTMMVAALSPQHHRVVTQRTAGPIRKLVETLTATDPSRLAAFNAEYEALVSECLMDNVVRQDYLLTRATKI